MIILLLFPIGIILCIMGCYCGNKASKAWALYLTPTGIHYTKVTACCGYRNKFIPLCDIEDIFVHENVVVQRGRSAPTRVVQSESVKVFIEQSKVMKYHPWSACLQPDYLEFTHVVNACEFIVAVKRIMAGRNAPLQRLDENGEVILAMGICDCDGVRKQVGKTFDVVGMILTITMVLIPVGFILFIVGYFCAKKASIAWRLYLTPTGIHYTRVGVSSCCYKKMFIPLRDIEDIFVQEDTDLHHTVYSRISWQKRVKVVIEQNKLVEYLTCFQRLFSEPNCLEFTNVENASDFVAAVKQQMTTT